jgi:hypothetical protein
MWGKGVGETSARTTRPQLQWPTTGDGENAKTPARMDEADIKHYTSAAGHAKAVLGRQLTVQQLLSCAESATTEPQA